MRATIIAAVVAIIVTIPTTVAATHLFGDVPHDHPHAAGIRYAVDAGITQGCGDGSDYCPDRPVTRDQMATFLHRQSGNGDVAPSVNADTLRGLVPSELQRRVTGECAQGGFVTGITAAGGVRCGTLALDVHVESYTAEGGSYVTCPAGFGYVATGGGFSTEATDAHVYKTEPSDVLYDQGWTSRVAAAEGAATPLASAFVVCVRLIPSGGQ